MNVNQIKLMLELQALQTFNNEYQKQTSNPLFQQLLTDFLSGSDQSASLQGSGSLGTVASLEPYLNLVNTPMKVTALPPVKLTKLSGATNNQFEELIQKASEMFNVPVNLIKSVISQESNFNPNAISPAGASGLMQLMPETARGLGVKNIFDPEENIFGGVKYLRQMLDRYGDNIELALAAYNAGPGNVDKYGGVPPFKETLNYVKKITGAFIS